MIGSLDNRNAQSAPTPFSPQPYPPEGELLARKAKLAELVPDHLLSYADREELLAVVDHELEADKVGHDGTRARLCVDWQVVLQRLLEVGEGCEVWALG